MAAKSGFFNSINGDRLYTAEDIGNYFGGILTNGVLQNYGSGLLVGTGNGLTVQVLDGKALIDCKYFLLDTFENVAFSTPSATYDRIDTVVIRYSEADRNITLAVVEGIPAATPTPEPLTRTAAIKEYALAYVRISANATEINMSDITDKRADPDVCGWVGLSIGGGSSGGTLTKTEETFTASSTISSFTIQNSNYSEGCPVLLHSEGMLMRESSDYMVNGNTIELASPASSGQTFTTIVFSLS